MRQLGSTLRTIWRLALPYYRSSQDRWPGRILLAAVIGLQLALVALSVALNQWNNRFYTALQNRDWATFVAELRFFCLLAVIHIVLVVYQLYLNQWLQIRWRRWMTGVYLSRWLAPGNHYRMQLLGDAADNPDQRIADDIDQFVGSTLSISVGLLGQVVTLFSFVAILWGLSSIATLSSLGLGFDVPGYLVWVALVYSVIGTVFTHLVGRPLIRLAFLQQRYEADFRFNLVRVRENSEQIALLRGEAAETDRLLDRFGHVVANWLAIMKRQKKLTFLTAGYDQISIVFPFVVVSPAYFAGAMQLGGLTQTASAFGQVQGALSFFVDAYTQLATWRAVVERLAGFDGAIAAAQTVASTPPSIQAVANGHHQVELEQLEVHLPDGRPLVSIDELKVAPGHSVLVTGPSGSGKSTTFRAVGGIWPFGSGRVEVPRGTRVMLLPQRPYFPVATLEVALTYPAQPGAFSREQLAGVLRAVGLPGLVDRLAEEAHWNRMLSLGEQQRLGIARALLQAPDYLFLDEATASLDEPAEAAMYKLLEERLPSTAIVSIGHRSSLNAFHERRVALEPDGEHFRLREMSLLTE